MKTNKIIYWVTTGLVGAFMLMSAGMYISGSAKVVEGIKSIGFPPFFLYLLGTAKALGAIALLQQKFAKLREWAYAGFTYVFISAAWAHIASGVSNPSGPIIFLIVLGVSYFFNTKLAKTAA